MESEAYRYAKLYRLPAHLCYACKRGDIDTCLGELGIDPPFHDAVMAKGVHPDSAFKLAFQKESFEIASAESLFTPHQYRGVNGRAISRKLWINAIPKEYAAQVRALMRTEGLRTLLAWFRRAMAQSETWQAQNHKASLLYHRNDDRLELKEDI